MFQKIVLPLDLTDRHQQAIDVAADMAARGGGVITLLHVIETIAGISLDEEKDFFQRLERAARSHLDRWGKNLEARQVSWRAEVRYGHRAAECVRYALEASADLVVLTAPRIDPTNLATIGGSMSFEIGLLVQCPVLLVK